MIRNRDSGLLRAAIVLEFASADQRGRTVSIMNNGRGVVFESAINNARARSRVEKGISGIVQERAISDRRAGVFVVEDGKRGNIANHKTIQDGSVVDGFA